MGVLVAQLIKNPPAMQETLVQFLGAEDPLKKGSPGSENTTHSSILRFPGGSDGKNSPCNVGDLSWISGLGKSPGGERGNSPHYSGEYWRIPWIEQSGRLQSIGLQRVRHD